MGKLMFCFVIGLLGGSRCYRDLVKGSDSINKCSVTSENTVRRNRHYSKDFKITRVLAYTKKRSL